VEEFAGFEPFYVLDGLKSKMGWAFNTVRLGYMRLLH
jgi:hypothetical protein